MTTKLATPKTQERRLYVLPPGIEPAPDILDDDMPDAMYQHPFFFTIIEVIRAFFGHDEDTLVDGDFPLYYLDADGKRQYVKPDCGVAFGVDPQYIYARNGYFLEEVGKTLNFVLEIASTTTADNDTGRKRDLYEWLKVPEYFGFDGTGGEYYQAPLFGWRLRDGKYVPVQTTLDDNGATWAYSEQLGLYFCAEPKSLRAWDPRSKKFLRTLIQTQGTLGRVETELRVERIVSQNAREARQAALDALKDERDARQAEREGWQTEREGWQTEREDYAARIRELEERLRGEGD